MSTTRERFLVFTFGLTLGCGLGVIIGHELYYGVGYEVFKDNELAAADDMDFADPAEFTSEAVREAAAATTPTEAESLSDTELNELKRLILPRLNDADIDAWRKSRAAQAKAAASDGAAAGG